MQALVRERAGADVASELPNLCPDASYVKIFRQFAARAPPCLREERGGKGGWGGGGGGGCVVCLSASQAAMSACLHMTVRTMQNEDDAP